MPGTFVQLSVGYTHFCGIKTDGRIACWGSNTYPRCDPVGGYCYEVYVGQANPRLRSQANRCLPATTTPAACSSTVTWTAGAWRVTGRWTASAPSPGSPQPTGTLRYQSERRRGRVLGRQRVLGKMAQPPAGEKFTKLATGENHVCGITPERDVKCWGGNTWGQAPKLRAGPYTEIGAGDLFTCGLKATGEIDCWGYNFFGQTNAPDGTLDHPRGGRRVRLRQQHGHGCVAVLGMEPVRQRAPQQGPAARSPRPKRTHRSSRSSSPRPSRTARTAGTATRSKSIRRRATTRRSRSCAACSTRPMFLRRSTPCLRSRVPSWAATW